MPDEATSVPLGRKSRKPTRGERVVTRAPSSTVRVLGADIVGREQQLAQVSGLLDRCAGGPAALLLEGEAGAGKSTLWRAGLADARARSYRALVARPAEIETKLSFGALADLLEPVLSDVLPELPEPQRRALEVALLLEPAREPPDRRAIAAGFLNALRTLASTAPLLVAIDDLQWLDISSEGVVAYAARRLRREPIGFMLTCRAGERAMPTELELALSGERLERVPVGPLSLGALHRVLRTRLGFTFSRPVLRRLHDLAGGNPFYALEIAHAVGSGRRQLVIPENLHDLVRNRLEGLPERTMDALLVAAVLSEPTLARVEAVIGADAAALDPARHAGILEAERGRLRFTHPLYASTVYALAGPFRRRELHRRVAQLLEEPEERARHLALATEDRDELAARAVEQAAGSATARGAPGAAAELLEQAVRLTPRDEREAHTRRTLAAADSHLAAGDWDQARTLLRGLAEEEPPGRLRAAAAARLAVWVLEDVGRGLALCEQAAAEDGGDPSVRALVELGFCANLHLVGDYRGAISHARAAVDAAERCNEPGLLAASLTYLGMFESMTARPGAIAHLERAAALELDGRRLLPVRPGTWLGLRHLWADELEEARHHLEDEYRRALEHGDDAQRSGVLLHLAELEWRAGDWVAASRHAEDGYELAEQIGDTQGRGALLYARALVEGHLGNVEAARAATAEGLALASTLSDRLFPVMHAVAAGALETSVGDHEAALAYVGSLSELLEEMGIEEPGIAVYQGDEIEALIGVGALARAATRIASLAGVGVELDRPRALAVAARSRGLLAAARGDVEGALAALEQALDHHDRLPVPLERGRTLLHCGIVLRRLKRKRDARERLQAALSIFEELGAAIWASRVRGELARISGSARATGADLTETERQIARLVAAGSSNKQVAAQLFVTVRTVESNLTRIYKKLGVVSRVQLAQHLNT